MSEQLPAPVWPGIPKNSSEYITLIAHYYRAEMARMSGWRDRIDRNERAITVAGAMLSVCCPPRLIMACCSSMVLVLLFLVIESRRYRFSTSTGRGCASSNSNTLREFHLDGERDTDWIRTLSKDLQKPVFLMGHWLAFSRRLQRNYIWMFLIVLIGWLLKISTPKLMPDGTPGHFAHSLPEWATGAAIGPVPGWAVVLAVAAFYCSIICAALRRYAGEGELSIGDVHV
jgi:uncharacterized membrane protein